MVSASIFTLIAVPKRQSDMARKLNPTEPYIRLFPVYRGGHIRYVACCPVIQSIGDNDYSNNEKLSPAIFFTDPPHPLVSNKFQILHHLL